MKIFVPSVNETDVVRLKLRKDLKERYDQWAESLGKSTSELMVEALEFIEKSRPKPRKPRTPRS